VKKFLAEVGLPEGYAWCDAFQSYEEHGVAGHKLPIESASSPRPTRPRSSSAGSPPRRPAEISAASTGRPRAAVRRPHLPRRQRSSFGAYWKLRTVEGNTSSGVAGSQSDGDGIYLRTRIISKRQVAFVRIPGVLAVVYTQPPAQLAWADATLADLMAGSVNQAMIDSGHAVAYNP
jgi:hypothetical protein